MSLEFYIGSAGTGKTREAVGEILRLAAANPADLFFVVVPEQFTMQTQRTVVSESPGRGILNIDVLSFQRLAYRVFEETGGDTLQILEDTGKLMLLRKIALDRKEELPYLGGQMRKSGILDEVKSLFSEFIQYEIGEDALQHMLERTEEDSLFGKKLHDIKKLYHWFQEYLKDHYMTSEEIMEVLAEKIGSSGRLRGSTVLLDGFTGFTPVQLKVVRELLKTADKVMVTVTMDAKSQIGGRIREGSLFSMSGKMVNALLALSGTGDASVHTFFHTEKTRFHSAPALLFLEQNLFRYRNKTFPDRPGELRMFCASDPAEEMEHAACMIARLVREEKLKYGDFAVVTGNLERYADLAEQAFLKYHIPCFIDQTRSLLHNPLVECVMGALEIFEKDFSYEAVFRYLRSSLSSVSMEEADLLENYVLSRGIRGEKMWDSTWTYLAQGQESGELLCLNQIRERFLAETSPLREIFKSTSAVAEDFCRALYRFLEELGAWDKLQERAAAFALRQMPDEEKEYRQIYTILLQLLDRMASILGREKLTVSEFRELLETGCSKAKVGLLPQGQDQVLVGDMERTRLSDVRILFFVGVNEGNVPKEEAGGGILGEADRELFEKEGIVLAPSLRERTGIQRFYLYLNLTKPSEKLFLSYANTNNEGEAISPAYLIHSLKKLYPALPVEKASAADREAETPEAAMSILTEGLREKAYREDNPAFSGLYSWFMEQPEYREHIKRLTELSLGEKTEDRISRLCASLLYGKVSENGATRLERFAECACAHFLRYGMLLTERQEYEFRPVDFGNLVHKALEQISLYMRDEKLSWGALTEEKQKELVDRSLAGITEEGVGELLGRTARNAYQLKRTRRILLRTVWALKKQMEHGAFVPEDFEVSIGGGRIDRLDTLQEDGRVYVKIMDYKTGNTSFDLVALYHGIQLQLAVYMNGALELLRRKHPGQEVIPAGMFYYRIKDPVIDEKITADIAELERKLFHELRLDGCVNADPAVASRMDSTYESLPVSPNKKTGVLPEGKSTATNEQFRLMMDYVKVKSAALREDILAGETGAEPVQYDDHTSCDYCPYQTVCGFDRKIPAFRVRRLSGSREEIWQRMEKEVEEHGGIMDRGTAAGHHPQGS